MLHLPLGKLPRKILEKKILNVIETDETVLLPPKYGEDGSIVRSKSNLIVSAADPITGATKDVGWLAVIVNSNDIAVHAAQPTWFTSILLFPESIKEKQIDNVISGIKEGLNEVGAVLIGGHTEITDRVKEIIIAGFMMGVPFNEEKFVTSGGGKPGDVILMTKGAGLEGTYILATDFNHLLNMDKKTFENIRDFRRMINVLPEVKILVENLGVENIHAMHDATEGGLLNAVYEMSIASNLGFSIYSDNILIRRETLEVCDKLGIDPLKLISSGTLIAAVPKELGEEAVRVLKKNKIEASIIGKLTESEERLLFKDDKIERITSDIVDELWRFIDGLVKK